MSIVQYRIYCITDETYRYWHLPDKLPAPTTCPDNPAHSIKLLQTTIVDRIGTTTEIQPKQQAARMLYEPIIQNEFSSNILHPQFFEITSMNGADYNISENLLGLSISTTAESKITFRSRRCLKYICGYPVYFSGAVIFDLGAVADSEQFCGLSNFTNDIGVGYIGNEFGVRYSRGGSLAKASFKILTASNAQQNITIVLDGVEYQITIDDAEGDVNFTAYQISIGADFVGWNVYTVDDTVFFMAKIDEAKNGSYDLTSDGNVTADSTRISFGESRDTVFVPQSEWNGDSTLVELLNPGFFNTYEIEFGLHGFGNIRFGVYNGKTEQYETIHTFRFTNAKTSLSLTNANMFITYWMRSISSETALTAYFDSSFGAYIGKNTSRFVSPTYSSFSIKNLTSDVETNLLSLKTRLIINDVSLVAPIIIGEIRFSSDANSTTIFRVIKNPDVIGSGTVDDYPNYQYINKNFSYALVDKTSTSYTNGNEIATIAVPPNTIHRIDYSQNITTIEIFDSLLITAQIVDGNLENSGNVSVSVVFTDL